MQLKAAFKIRDRVYAVRREAEVAADMETVVDFDVESNAATAATIEGTVRVNGEVFTDVMWVAVGSEDGIGLRQVVEGGAFRIEGAPVGTVGVTVRLKDGDRPGPTFHETVETSTHTVTRCDFDVEWAGEWEEK